MSRIPDWLPEADELPHLWVLAWGFGPLVLLALALPVGFAMWLWQAVGG